MSLSVNVLMKKNINKLLLSTLIVSTSALSSGAFAKATPPEMKNKAYVLMDYNTGQILAQKNADKPLPPASLTKMMTSYIMEERLTNGKMSEDEKIFVSKKNSCAIGSGQSCMYVLPNKSASAIDILRGIVIQSGNDASAAAAEHMAGSESAFADLMNETATELGMENTHFVNATGMPAKDHYSSAMDLAKLARAIIKHGGKYYDIYSEKEFSYNGFTQQNRNALLNTDPTVDGLKTGHTRAAGYCLVASSDRNNMRLISVIMGAKTSGARARQSRELLNWGYGHFETIVKAPKGQFATKAPVLYGAVDEVELATADDLKVMIESKGGKLVDTVINLDKTIKAPITKGQKLGEMSAVIDGKTMATVDLVSTHEVAEAGFFKRMWQGIASWFKGLF